MSLLPAVLAGGAVTVALGLPVPARELWTSQRTPRRVPDPSPLVVAIAVLVALLVPLGPVGAAVAALLGALGVRALRSARLRRARDAERRGAAEALAVLAAELRAGRAPAAALAAAAEVAIGPTAAVLTTACRSEALGGGAAELLRQGAPGCAVPELLHGLAVCWQVCQGAGSSLAVAVDRLEDGLRAEQERRDAVETELASPRATAMLLSVLPCFGLLLGASLGAHPVHVLLHTALGEACLAFGVLADLLGLAWTRRLVLSAGGGA